MAADGPNALTQRPGTPWWRLLLNQFASPLIWLLLVAAIVSGALKEVVEAIAIVAIVLVNATVGFVQEFRAQASVLALRALTAPRARVVRDHATVQLAASEVVVGDVLLLESGDVVAADAELLEAHRLSTVEAMLTGESVPSEKSMEAVAPGAPLAEQSNRVFMGTAVATGTARAVVTATGQRTELGKIATLLDSATEVKTPLQLQLEKMSRTLMFVCLAVVALVAVMGAMRSLPWLDVFISSVSLAVAVVPEGLPAVVTIALAIGVRRMAVRHVLVRRLSSVETLGSATVIVTDKTGTLTTGQMELREVWGDEQQVLTSAVANVEAALDATGAWGVGDPTELALLVAAKKRGLSLEPDPKNPRVHVNPFDAERKRMSVLLADGVLNVKGAPLTVLPLCVAGTEGASEAAKALASKGLRVLAIAKGRGAKEESLTLLGLVGIADPPRPEAIVAVAAARKAGVRTVMATGDARETAEAIAKEMGLLLPGDDPKDVVHARVTPEDKLLLVRTLTAKDDVVAMVGDGTNDAPALKEAHIGIAMGVGGSEVTREAADLVLADDNFASIVAALKEGRGIADNIQKTLSYLLAGNAGELLTLFVAAAVGWPLPLLPLQLLWVNLVTDGFPALALVMDPAGDEVLSRPPKAQSQPMLGRREWTAIALVGVVIGAVTLSVFRYELSSDTLDHARTVAFSSLVFAQVFNAFGARSFTRTFLEVGSFTNLRLVAVVVSTALLQVGLMALPLTQRLFGLGSFSWRVLLISVVAGLVPITLVELAKLVRRLVTTTRVSPTPA
ncbi:MAG: HAD-IC family P-type ATPase [Archangiaceae bacterium]|nr:HAD-IC family P-type ATPase [Archangiaceae bacterium]